MPKTATAPERITADDALRTFRVGFHYLAAPPEEKSRVLNIVGRMIAQEFLPGASALDRDSTDRFVVATRAQQIDVRSLRRSFEQLLLSRQYHAEHHGEAEGNAAEAEIRQAEALERLEKAQEAYDRASGQAHVARGILDKVHQAEAALSTQCEFRRPALDHYEQLI